jgi:hypothetical protein
MTYLEDLASSIKRRVPPDLLPEGDTRTLFLLYALLALVKGADVTPEDVHHAWMAWKLEHDPNHPSLKPFAALDESTRRSDEPFAEAIRAAVRDHPVT